MRDLVLYCNCFAGHEPRHRQALQRDLMCGAANLTTLQRDGLRDRGFLFDDQGQNISHDNRWLGDLTGLYWVWQNTQDEWVGTNQYRRSYDDDEIAAIELNQHNLWISNWLHFPCSLRQQYQQCHGDTGLHVLWEAARQNRIPFTCTMVQQLDYITAISPCNMFFAHRTVFDRVCEILFDIILELHDGVKYMLPCLPPGPDGRVHARMLAFIAERCLTLIYHNARYFLGDIEVTPIRYYTHGSK